MLSKNTASAIYCRRWRVRNNGSTIYCATRMKCVAGVWIGSDLSTWLGPWGYCQHGRCTITIESWRVLVFGIWLLCVPQGVLCNALGWTPNIHSETAEKHTPMSKKNSTSAWYSSWWVFLNDLKEHAQANAQHKFQATWHNCFIVFIVSGLKVQKINLRGSILLGCHVLVDPCLQSPEHSHVEVFHWT